MRCAARRKSASVPCFAIANRSAARGYCSQTYRGSWTGRRPGSGGPPRLGDICGAPRRCAVGLRLPFPVLLVSGRAEQAVLRDLERVNKNPSVPFINSKVPTQYLSNLGPAELRDGERKAEFSVSFPSRALYHGNIPEKCTKVESFNARPRNRTVAIAPFRNACDLKYCVQAKSETTLPTK